MNTMMVNARKRVGICFLTCLILLALQCVRAQEQAPVVTGTVIAESGSPLAFANVQAKNTATQATASAITDEKGIFVFRQLKAGSTYDLTVSYVGYETYVLRKYKVAPGQKNSLLIKLKPGENALDQVVVTALGIRRDEKALGYSLATVKGEEVSNVREANFVKSLAGKVAGVNIRNTGSDPGASVLIYIRGQSSLIKDNQPLFVVDGVPVGNAINNTRERVGSGVVDNGNAISDISPDDIASITVLKGASAAALYGSRAGNGVILITTKTGKSNRKGLGVSVNSSVMFDKASIFPLFQSEFGDGNIAAPDSYTTTGVSWGPAFKPGDKYVQWNSPLDDNGKPVPTEWKPHPNRIKDFFRTGYTVTNNVAMSGNSNDGYFRLSYTNLYNEGIVPNTNLKRNNLALSAGYNLSSKVKVGTNIAYTNTGSDNRPLLNRGSVFQQLYNMPANMDINDLRDYWVKGKEGFQQRNPKLLTGDVDNLFFIAYENTNPFERNRITGNVQLSIDITRHLGLMVRTGLDHYSELFEARRGFSAVKNPNGAYSIDNEYFREQNTDFLLTYKRDITKDWFFSVSAGGNRMDQSGHTNGQLTQDLSIPGIYNITNAKAGTVKYSQSDYRRRMNSLYSMGQVAYKGMVFLDVTARNDWSSTLPAQHNSFFYPSVSMSAIVSDILQIKSGPLSFAKLRASWAQVGTDAGPYQLYNTIRFDEDWGSVKRATIDFVLKNNLLKPEIATSYEFGADVRFFNGRLGLDATWYKTSSKNQILTIPTTMSSGYGSKIINAGEIQNKGWELTLTGAPFAGAFRWDVAANFTRNRNKVVKLAKDLQEVLLNSAEKVRYYVREGQQMGDMYAVTWLTVPDGPYKGQPLLNENGTYQKATEYKKIGNYNPDFMLGLTNTFNYKGFTLEVLLDWRQGGQFASYAAKNMLSNGATTNTLFGRDAAHGGLPYTGKDFVTGQPVQRNDGMILDGYIANPDGTYRKNTAMLVPNVYYGEYYWEFDERSTYSATYVKLRELSLSYTFNRQFASKLRMQRITLGFIARNLFNWNRAEAGFDPEVAMTAKSDGFYQGVAGWALPGTRSYGFKVSCDF